MKYMMIVVAMLALAGCDATEESVNKGGNMLKTNYDTTRKKLSKWIYRWNDDESQPPAPKMLANAYCYDVGADILCYDQPQEKLGTRLVAYQGSTAYPPGTPPLPPVGLEVSQTIISHDIPPPFAPASPETMAKVHASGQSGSSYTNYSTTTSSSVGSPKTLMHR